MDRYKTQENAIKSNIGFNILCVAMHDNLAGFRWARRLVFQAGMAEPPALA